MTRFANLPPDILHCLLLHIRDFYTLSAILRTVKAIYNVFQEYPLSIVTTVASNVVGGIEVLPAAVRLVEWQRSETVCYEESAMVLYPLTRKSCVMLEDNATMIAKLEALFSEMNKDQTTRRSQLSPVEALRFRRAAYRFWLYSGGILSFSGTQEFLDDDEIAQDIAQFRSLLNGLPTAELFELDRFVSFLRDLVKQTRTAAYPTPISINFPAEPFEPGDRHITKTYSFLLSSFEEARWWPTHEPPMVSYSAQIQDIYSSRHITTEAWHNGVAGAIVNSINGAGNTCYCCHEVNGLDLWNISSFVPLSLSSIPLANLVYITVVSDWHRLRYRIDMITLWQLVGSRLQHNDFEMRCFVRACHPGSPYNTPFTWTGFLQTIFAMDSDERGPLECTQWYCQDCLMDILRLRLRRWLVECEYRGLGPLIGPHYSRHDLPVQRGKCWFGHECKKQVRSIAHSERLSHLYDPVPMKVKGQAQA